MKRRHRRRALLAWLSGLLVAASPFTWAAAREVETDGIFPGGAGPTVAADSGLLVVGGDHRRHHGRVGPDRGHGRRGTAAAP